MRCTVAVHGSNNMSAHPDKEKVERHQAALSPILSPKGAVSGKGSRDGSGGTVLTGFFRVRRLPREPTTLLTFTGVYLKQITGLWGLWGFNDD